MNVNPRSLYNKADQFKVFIKEKNVQLITVSESWQREDISIEDLIGEENFTVVSNPYQRKGRGGRTLIMTTQNTLLKSQIFPAPGVLRWYGAFSHRKMRRQ